MDTFFDGVKILVLHSDVQPGIIILLHYRTFCGIIANETGKE